jgi:hypothetical protein
MQLLFMRSAAPLTPQDLDRIQYVALGLSRRGDIGKLENIFSRLNKPEHVHALKSAIILNLVGNAKEYSDTEKVFSCVEKGFDFGKLISANPDLEKKIWLMPYPDLKQPVVWTASRLIAHCISDKVVRSDKQEYIPSFPDTPVNPLNPFYNPHIKTIGAVQAGLVDYFKYGVDCLPLNHPAARLKLLLDNNQLGPEVSNFITRKIETFTIPIAQPPKPRP